MKGICKYLCCAKPVQNMCNLVEFYSQIMENPYLTDTDFILVNIN